MKKIAVITDTNSGMTPEDAKEHGIIQVPMPFLIDEVPYLDTVNLTQDFFFEKLEAGADVSTSQPSPGSIKEIWDEALKTNDEVVYIPMSSGLSQSCETAKGLAEEYNGRVEVVDNRRISVTMRLSALDAVQLAAKGYDAKQIREILEREGSNSSIYITVDTLKYLKKGGRVTAAGAAIGTVLNIKPVLQIQGGKLDAKAKARGMKNARKLMIEAVKNDCATRFKEAFDQDRVIIQTSCTKVSPETLQSWLDEVQAAFPGKQIHHDPLALSIACHIGTGALAVTATQIPAEL